MSDLITSLQLGIPSAIVVLIFLIVSKIIDAGLEKDKNKKEIKVNSEVIECFNNLNVFLKHITEDLINKENDKCASAIKTAFKSSSYSITRFATFTIINNNVETNRKNIEDNINNIVDKEYANVYNALMPYYSKDNHLIDYMKEEWKDILKKDLRDIIFNDKLDKINKLYTIHNKVDITIDRFYSYLNNKFLNNE